MKSAIVSYPHAEGKDGKIEAKRKLMTSESDLKEFFRIFPQFKGKKMEEMFKREIRENGTLIINGAGGWCIEGGGIKIVQYL